VSCPTACQINPKQTGLVLTNFLENQAILNPESCGSFNHALPNDSFKLLYHTKDFNSPSKNRDVVTIQGGAIIPDADFDQTKFGWNIEIDNENDTGYCIISPNVIAGPYSKVELESCIQDLEFTCYRIETEANQTEALFSPAEAADTCPCFDVADVSRLENMLRNEDYDPTFVVDLYKSCKDPEENDGLPYGIHTKPMSRFNTNKGSMNKWQVGLAVDSYSVGIDLAQNQCFKDSASNALTTGEFDACFSAIDHVCSNVETLTRRPTCEDDPKYTFRNDTVSTCENMFPYDLGPKTKQRRCQRYDNVFDTLVLQKCRKSCEACTCARSDNSDFGYNGQSDYNCEWIASHDNKNSLCSDVDVAANCPITCKTDCCRDNRDFAFKLKKRIRKKYGIQGFRGMMGCDDIGNSNWMNVCQDKNVAKNCPFTCRKCVIQPRL